MEGLAELHTHLGGSVASDILWSLAHEQGIALPVKDYWEFDRLVTVPDPRGVANLERGALSSSCRPALRKESGWRARLPSRS